LADICDIATRSAQPPNSRTREIGRASGGAARALHSIAVHSMLSLRKAMVRYRMRTTEDLRKSELWKIEYAGVRYSTRKLSYAYFGILPSKSRYRGAVRLWCCDPCCLQAHQVTHTRYDNDSNNNNNNTNNDTFPVQRLGVHRDHLVMTR
jgi:hypothetical protein